MATRFFLLVVLTGATRAGVPQPCQDRAPGQCQEVAAGCPGELDCSDLDTEMARGSGQWPGRGKLCTLCTKVLQRLEAKAGQKPDQDKVKMTLDKGCQALGQPLASTCRWLVKKFRQKVRVALQTGELPQKFCTALRLCKG